MAKNTKDAKATRRTQVKDLPKEQQELSREEQQKVKGGGGGEGGWPGFNKPPAPNS